jgi:hypothetical protein
MVSAKHRRSSSRRHLAALAFLVLIIGGVYFSILLGSASLKTNANIPTGPLFTGDPTAGGAITLPFEYLISLAWSGLHLPIVNPFQGYGVPLLASQGVPVFVPEILAHLLFPHNYSIWNVVRVVILAWGTYLLVDSFDLSFGAALAAGVAAGLAGVVPPNVNLGMLNPLITLPFILLALRHLLDSQQSRPRVWILGLVTGVVFLALSGFQELLPLMGVVIVIFGVAMIIHFHTISVAPRRLIWTLLAGVVGLIIGSVGYLPTLTAVASGMGSNSSSNHLFAVPSWWMGTLSMPLINGKSLVAHSQDLGQTVWILGTPIFFAVIIISFIVAVRYAKSTRWFVYPSLALTVFGILGYIDAFGVLHIFGFFPFDSIDMDRFLQFAWWLPWCLLLGITITYGRRLRVAELVGAVVFTTGIDIVGLLLFAHRLTAMNLTPYVHKAVIAGLLAFGLCIVFVASLAIDRFVHGVWLSVLLVIVMAVFYLPTNFYPTAGGQIIIRPQGVGNNSLVFYLNQEQLPAQTSALNDFTPVAPTAYNAIVQAIFPSSDLTNKTASAREGLPTAEFAKTNPALIAKLDSLGVTDIVDPGSLSIGEPIPTCSSHQSTIGLCAAGTVALVGSQTDARAYIYHLTGASAVVDPVTQLKVAPTASAALRQSVRAVIADKRTMPATAFLSGPIRATRPVTSAEVVSRSFSSDSVTIRLHSSNAGVVVLRQSDLPGMSCMINNVSVACDAADGGLWTAVHVPQGRSTIRLNYLSGSVAGEFLLAEVGLIFLAVAWIGVGVMSALPRKR